PEIWDPWTGATKPFRQFERHGDTIQARLEMDGYGSVLLVFDPAAMPVAKPVERQASRLLAQVAVGQNGWKFHGVGIGPGSQPETVDLDIPNLIDWTMTPQLKNFSGRGVYTTSFTVPPGFIGNDHRVILDLGDVKDAAEISINGNAGPALLLRPYKADVTGLIHAGKNTLQITVVNTLYNALSARGPSANFDVETTNTANGLMAAGLIGPVRLEEMQQSK
ncbi:MAG: glycosylhydrolase-like jelly roll fold domain-containing protein, partial [Acidobacteriaceae bacterium]